MDNKDRLIVAQNCNTATSKVMAALVRVGTFTYEDVRAHWGDLHLIINTNTWSAAAAQAITEAIPGTQVMPTPPPPVGAPPAPPAAASAPPAGQSPRSRTPWIRQDGFETIANAINYERLSGITFGSMDSNFYCNQTVKAEGNLNGRPINSQTYPHAKVKPERNLSGDWAEALLVFADHAIDFDKLPDSFVRPPAYVR
jgi:hypothetical protein